MFLVVWIGSGWLLFILKEVGFDMLVIIKIGFNILYIVCMSEKLKDDYYFCKYLFSNYKNINFKKIDLFGWNVCYFVFMFNFKVLEFIVKDLELCKLGLIMEKIELEKMCLYIVCEYV